MQWLQRLTANRYGGRGAPGSLVGKNRTDPEDQMLMSQDAPVETEHGWSRVLSLRLTSCLSIVIRGVPRSFHGGGPVGPGRT
jgi:hypothetical protein